MNQSSQGFLYYLIFSSPPDRCHTRGSREA
uniref:Uncharacterized protein n=1 Tax=Arundo donax TaxID=35708 RepID=A0A0A8Z390_ARUDO